MADASGGTATAGGGHDRSRPPPSSATAPTATHDGAAGDVDDGWAEGAGAEASFRQIPINALMDHNDDVRRVCDDFTRALK